MRGRFALEVKLRWLNGHFVGPTGFTKSSYDAAEVRKILEVDKERTEKTKEGKEERTKELKRGRKQRTLLERKKGRKKKGCFFTKFSFHLLGV